MASQRDVKNRISSIKNIEKITRAMEMVAAARLRRAEQRIQALRPYASAIRRMTRQAAEAAENIPNLPVLEEHENVNTVGLLLVTGDRGLAGAFNSQIIRAGMRAAAEHEEQGRSLQWYASGRRGVSTLRFRKRDPAGAYVGFTDRPQSTWTRTRYGATGTQAFIAPSIMVAWAMELPERIMSGVSGPSPRSSSACAMASVRRFASP